MIKQIGKYKVLRILGQGSMGTVLLVKDSRVGKQYAVKMVMTKDEKDCTLKKMMLKKEWENLMKLSDRRIPYVVDFLEEEDFSAIVMEYVQGISFEECLSGYAPLSEEEALFYFRQMTEIIAYLHKQQPPLVYRDLKPDNFVITAERQLRLVDFGTALDDYDNTKTALSFGTYGYSAPEQRKGKPVTTAADVYALGAVLFYMLTGINPTLPPFEVADIRKVSLTVSSSFCNLVENCCKKEPENRIQDAGILLSELDKISLKKETWKSKILGVLYYTLFFTTAAYAGISIWQVKFYSSVGKLQLICALGACIMVLLIGKIMELKDRKRNFIKKRDWNILYTNKKTIGLYMLVFVIFTCCGCVQDKKEAEPFVTIENYRGQNVLIKEGCIYETTEMVHFIMPVEAGKEYEIVFMEEGTGEGIFGSRIFRIQGENGD